MKYFISFLICTLSISENAISDENRTFYNVNYLIEDGRPDGQGAWFPKKPNGPYMVPSNRLEYRTGDPDHRNGYSSGHYFSSDPKIIKLHTYWMGALGINTVIIGWAALGLTNSVKHLSTTHVDALVRSTCALANTSKSIDDFVPPKAVVAIGLNDIDAQALNDAFLTSNQVHDFT